MGMSTWELVREWTFGAGPDGWKVISDTGAITGDPVIVDDGGIKAIQALGTQRFEYRGPMIPVDPSSLYRLEYELRTKTAATPNDRAFAGCTGWSTETVRCNRNGANSFSTQPYPVLHDEAVGTVYLTRAGYIQGQFNPGDRGSNPNWYEPLRLHPGVVGIRPQATLLRNAGTTGEQLMSAVRLWRIPKAADRIVVNNADRSEVAWVELMQWPEDVFTRPYAVLPVHNRPEPVVIVEEVWKLPTGEITFLVHSREDFDALYAVLTFDTTKKQLTAPASCPGVDSMWFVPLSITRERWVNKGSDTNKLVRVPVQWVQAPA